MFPVFKYLYLVVQQSVWCFSIIIECRRVTALLNMHWKSAYCHSLNQSIICVLFMLSKQYLCIFVFVVLKSRRHFVWLQQCGLRTEQEWVEFQTQAESRERLLQVCCPNALLLPNGVATKLWKYFLFQNNFGKGNFK